MYETPEAAIAAEIAAHEARLAKLRAAHANPTPGPLAGAFDVPAGPAPDPASMALARIGRKLRPVVAADFLVLKALNSPLYRQAKKSAAVAAGAPDSGPAGACDAPGAPDSGPAGPATEHDETDAAEMLFQFTTPVRECRALLATGRQAFREAAISATLDLLTPLEIPAAVEAVVANFVSAFETTLGHRAATPEGEQRVDFSQGSQVLPMVSAGGCITSPCSAGNSTGLLMPC